MLRNTDDASMDPTFYVDINPNFTFRYGVLKNLEKPNWIELFFLSLDPYQRKIRIHEKTS